MNHFACNGRSLFCLLLCGWPLLVAGQFTPDAEYQFQSGLALINADQAYGQGYSGSGVAIGVVETGLNPNHSEFAGALLTSFDSVRETAELVGQPLDYHGSHVTGIIGARRDGAGMHGVAWAADLIVTTAILSVGTELDIAEAIDFNVANGARVINNSWGTFAAPVADRSREFILQNNRQLVPALQRAVQADRVLVFATGNDSLASPSIESGLPYHFPELQSHWLAVMAVDLDGLEPVYTNRCGVAAEWCLAAPGGGDFVDTGIRSVNGAGNDGYKRLSGTSMAAPHVSGTVALVAEKYPYLTGAQLASVILTTAQDLGAPGVDAVFGRGLLDAGAAINGPGALESAWLVDTAGTSSTWSNDIGGAGALVKGGAGTLTLSGNNSWSGGTTVEAGTLILNGSVASEVMVARFATLKGSGRVHAPLRVRGRLQPGESIGTFSAAELRLHPAAVLEVELDDAGNSDRLAVTGSAGLDGELRLLPRPGIYGNQSEYIVLTAGGDISGEFTATRVPLEFAYLDTGLTYAANAVTLTLAPTELHFSGLARTPNQQAIAGVLDAADYLTDPGLLEVINNLLVLPETETRAALTALGGEGLVNSSAGAVAAMQRLAGNVSRRLADLTAGAAPAAAGLAGRLNPLGYVGPFQPRMAGIGTSAGTPAVAGEPANRFRHEAGPGSPIASWLNVFGDSARREGGALNRQVEYDSYGANTGADLRLGPRALAGVAAGYSRTDLRYQGLPGRAEVDSWSLGLYAAWQPAPAWLGVMLGYTASEHESRRDIAFNTLERQARAGFDSETVSAQAAAGVTALQGQWYALRPWASLQYLRDHQDAYRESGAGVLNLGLDGQELELLTGAAGLRLGAQMVLTNDMHLEPGLELGWQREFGDTGRDLAARLPALSGDRFTITGAGAPRDRLLIGADLRLHGGRYEVYAGYQLTSGGGLIEHALTLGIDLNW